MTTYADFLQQKPGRLPLACYGQRQFFPKQPVIYALLDPETRCIRYIGKTAQHPRTRLIAHLQERSNCHRAHWIASLMARGLRPVLVVLEALLNGGSTWQDRERWWIAYGREQGWPLTNNTSGGDGVSDLPEETRQRMRRVWLGRKHSPESIVKLKLARARRITSDATRAKMSLSQRGRQILWIDKIRERVRKLTPEQVQQIQAALSTGSRVIDLAKTWHLHRTTVSKIKAGTYYAPGQKR